MPVIFRYSALLMIIAVCTSSWGIIDLGNTALAQLLFSSIQERLPVFSLAATRFVLTLITLLFLFTPLIICSKKCQNIVLKTNIFNPFSTIFWHHVVYSILWGLSISMFIVAFQFTQHGELVFIVGLCSFSLLHELHNNHYRLDDRMVAIISFNLFIPAFFIFAQPDKTLWVAGHQLHLLVSISLFVLLYHLSFVYKNSSIFSDCQDEQILMRISNGQKRRSDQMMFLLCKLVLQFFVASIVALICLATWIELTADQYAAFQWASTSTTPSLVAIAGFYILFATLVSYFAFNYAIERLNEISRLDATKMNGGSAAAYLASLEPLTACAIAFYMSDEPKYYLIGSVTAFGLLMLYLKQRHIATTTTVELSANSSN